MALGITHAADDAAGLTESALTIAYKDAGGRTPATTVATELGGSTKIPGVYDSVAGTFVITGTVTLNAQGDPNAVFIFKTASTLITASGSRVAFAGGANPCNVFWQVGSSAGWVRAPSSGGRSWRRTRSRYPRARSCRSALWPTRARSPWTATSSGLGRRPVLVLGALLFSIGYAKARARRTRNHIK